MYFWNAELAYCLVFTGRSVCIQGDWGEQMVGVCHAVLVVLDVESEEIKVVEGIPDYLSAGQVHVKTAYYKDGLL